MLLNISNNIQETNEHWSSHIRKKHNYEQRLYPWCAMHLNMQASIGNQIHSCTKRCNMMHPLSSRLIKLCPFWKSKYHTPLRYNRCSSWAKQQIFMLLIMNWNSQSRRANCSIPTTSSYLKCVAMTQLGIRTPQYLILHRKQKNQCG